MTLEDLEKRLDASYEVEKQAKKVAKVTMNKCITEYINRTASTKLNVDAEDYFEYRIKGDKTVYSIEVLNFTYTDQDYIVTITSNIGQTVPLDQTDVRYNIVSDIILCTLNSN